MHRFKLPLTAFALLAALGLGGIALASSDLLKSQQRIATELELARQEAERAQVQAEANRPIYTALLMGSVFIALGVAGFFLWEHHQDRATQRSRLVPDQQGRYPLPDPHTFSREVANHLATVLYTGQLEANIQQAKASQLLPQHYAPRIEVEHAPAQLPSVPVPLLHQEPEPQLLPSGTVDMAGLLDDWKPRVDSILLGVGPGGTRYTVHASELCHVALAGPTGGGKSNIMRLLLSQLLAAGAKVVLADPHYTPYDPESGDDWKPIAGRLHLAPAVRASDIQHLLAWLATDELPQRLERRRQGERPGQPLFLAIDELPAIVADVKDAPDHMARILREGRKVGILLVTAAQDWLVKSIGGTGATRDNFRTAYYLGGDMTSARVLLDVQKGVDDGQLGQGLAFLRSKVTSPAQLVRVPLASNYALERLLPDFQQASSPILDVPTGEVLELPGNPAGTQQEPIQLVTSTASQSPGSLTAEELRVVSLFREGKDVAEIVRTLHPHAKQGRATQLHSAQVQEILRKVL